MKAILRFAIGLTALIGATLVHAQGCPPGQYPVVGQGWNYCAPTPGSNATQQKSPPPQIWKNQWQSIAVDAPKGILGTSNGLPDEESAKRAAIMDCRQKGGAACETEISTRNSCLAMVVGNKFIQTDGGETKAEAEQKALKLCNAGDDGCRVYYSACSMPVRTQ